MNSRQIKDKIADFEKIKSKSKEESEIKFCDAKIAFLNKQLEAAKKPVKKKVILEDDFEYDFAGRQSDHRLKEAKKRHFKKSILDEFADSF